MKKLPYAFLFTLQIFGLAQENEIPPAHELMDAVGEAGMRDERIRAEVVQQIRAYSEEQKRRGEVRSQAMGLPLRRNYENGRVDEVVGITGDQPIYHVTHNASAAISSAANLVRTNYLVDGTGLTVGVWDGGSARVTHQEFGTRVTSLDGASSIDHATHVAGTIAASGVQSSARGMAPNVTVDSYDWNNDLAEMTGRGASAAGQAGKIYLSNHSYGIINGWNYVNSGSPTRVWEWWGNGTLSTSFEEDFGRYNTQARDHDTLAYNSPYYLIFRSAGNERVDSPSAGQAVALTPGSSTVVAYDAATHPAGDGSYRGGYETIGYEAVAKNVITIGAVNDAVSGGVRSIANASMTSFSSWGPTDDGRIKPDVVANGASVYSSTNGSDTSYASYNGTSMATPSAAGSAALLIQHYGNLFPSQAMRSSSLKGLLIHTADDRGTAGPDYQFGWGLIHSLAAADLLTDHKNYPLKKRFIEGTINSTTTTTTTQEFIWDGISPIRATMCWTDPAGTSTSTSDLRSARLRNNLNLKILGPNNEEFLPYVMPFVGTWTQASMSAAAVTGVNNTDNVEQVFIATPPSPGVYRAIVSYSGTLTNNTQIYSLFLSGSANETPPPPPLDVSAISPNSALPSATAVTVSGNGFTTSTAIKLTKTGQADIEASAETLANGVITCQVDLTNAAAGEWNIVATNPGGETDTLENGFSVIGAIWSSTFDGSISGWTSSSTTGTNAWVTSTVKSKSPSTSYHCPGTTGKTTTYLTSPSIPIPAGATNLQLRFWHDFVTQASRDGGRLEFSLNNGAWFSPGETNSGAVFASNGYNSTIFSRGNQNSLSFFAGLSAWSGNSNGFIETVVNLTDTALYAGKNLRLRYGFATDSSTLSTGWYVDSLALIGGGNITNAPPVITVAANSNATSSVTDLDGTSYDIIAADQAQLTVTASDDGGENLLTYSWSATQPNGAMVSFSENQNNAAKATTAFFEQTGDYLFTVTVLDALGSSTTGTLAVRVQQNAKGIVVLPAQATARYGETKAFSATLVDQFDQAMLTQPSSFTWSTSAGTINTSGLYQASTTGGPFAITASHLTYQGTASITVSPADLEIALSNLEHVYDGSDKSATATTTPAGIPVVITYNASSALPRSAGSYAVSAASTSPNYQGNATATLTITDPYETWKTNTFDAGQIAAGDGAQSADPDGDGFTNWMEYHLGFDPLDPQSTLRLSIAMSATGTPILTLNRVVTAGTFHIQSSTTLTNDWVDLSPLTIPEAQTNFSVSLPFDGNRRFYRAVYTAPLAP